jgi:hypothetical protein
MQIARRSFLFGLGASLVAAPAIVRAASLMPVKALEAEYGLGPMMRAVALMHAHHVVNPPVLWRDEWHDLAQFIMPGTVPRKVYLQQSDPLTGLFA